MIQLKRILNPFCIMIFLILFSACMEQAFTPPPPKREELVPEPAKPFTEEINVSPVMRSLVFVSPDVPTTSDDIRVEAKAFDAENERIRYRYMWSVNGGEIRTEGRAFFPSNRHKKGDVVRIAVVASDGTSESGPSSLSVSIANSTPEWIEDPRNVRDINGHQVQAQDADGDPIEYSLEGAPKGMSIDSQTGKLSYKGRKDAKKGPYDVHVLATDTDGAFVKWSFSITVQ